MQQKQILGVILAGGASKRFGTDKCAVPLGGKSLLEWVIERARPQVGALVLNTNNEIDATSKIERVADDVQGQGPLAGILAGLRKAAEAGFSQVASFACDTPFFPPDTIERLAEALHNAHADFAVARCGPTVHRIFALWPLACRSRLETAFAAGARSMQSIENWLSPACADFQPNDGPGGDPFFNINTRADLKAAERWLSRLSQ